MKPKQLLVLLVVCLFLAGLFSFFVKPVHASTTLSITTGTGANDGFAYGASADYATAHGTATGSDNSSTNGAEVGQVWTGSQYEMLRAFFKFDTSSIPVGATITAAKLCLKSGEDESATDFTVCLQKWTGNTPIDTGDYNSFDGTNYDDGSFSTAGWVASGTAYDYHNNITISNFNLITEGGDTLIAVLSSRDISSTHPTGKEYVYIYSYESAPGAAPLLVVTYTVPVSITITSSPTGSGYVTVDGAAITTPQTYSWTLGDSHTIAANSPANTVAGQSQYIWKNWSDSGAQSHSITVPAGDTTYTANFQLQYYLTVQGGNSPSGQGWFNSSLTTTVTNTWVWNTVAGQSRTALTNYYLDNVAQNPSRSNTGNYTTGTITMSTYHNATFTSVTQYYLTVTGGNSISYGTASPTGDNWYDTGGSTTVISNWVWNSVAGQSRTALTNWQKDGVNQNPARQNSGTLTSSSVSMTTYHTVNFVSATQYYLTVTGGNSISYGTASPTSDNWYDSGTGTTVSSDWVWAVINGQSRTAVTNYAIDGASQGPARQGTGTLTTSSVTFSTYHTIVFASSTQYYVTLNTATVGTTVGQTGSQTADNWYDSASSASISATTPLNNGTVNRFIFLNWMWTQGGVSQANSSSTTFLISMSNYVSITAYWTEDLIDLYSYSIASSRVNVSDTAYINLTFRWSSDHVLVGSGFTVKVNGASHAMTAGWTNFTATSATVQTVTYQLTEAEGGAYYVNSVSPAETWERVKITTGGFVGASYVHVGSNLLVYYELHYESDNALVTDGTVLLNGSAMLYDGSLLVWKANVTSATMATNHYRISAVSGNLYGITALNDIAGLVGPFEWYANLNLQTVDVYSNPLTQAIVYMDNGSGGTIPSGLPFGTGYAIVGFAGWYSQAVSPSCWANWTGQTNGTINIYVSWYGLTVNQTFTLNYDTDVTLNITCLAYPYTVGGITFWAASNATVTASSYTSNILTLDFNSPVNNYMLIASCPIIPRYILNVTYDLATCFSSGYLSLTHYGNATLTLDYESWGDLYIQSTDQTLTSASIASGMLQILPAGTNGIIGTLQVYCGSLGNPTSTTGFTTGTFGSSVYTGTYVLTGYTLTLGWAVSPFSGGGTTGTTAPSLSVYFVLTFPSTASKGQIVNGTLTVTWQTYAMIYIWQVACNQPYTTWAVNIGALPLGLQSAQAIGNASIPVTLTIPTDVADGSYLVPCSITFQTPTGIAKTVGSTITLAVGPVAPTSNISMPYIVMAGFLGLFGLFLSTLFVRRSRSRKQQF